MNKGYQKEDWIKLLKDSLFKAPEHDGEHLHEFFSKEHVYITIIAGGSKKNRYYAFGGPIWSATIDFSDSKEIKIYYFSPLRKPKKVKWEKVKSISIEYCSE